MNDPIWNHILWLWCKCETVRHFCWLTLELTGTLRQGAARRMLPRTARGALPQRARVERPVRCVVRHRCEKQLEVPHRTPPKLPWARTNGNQTCCGE